MTKNSLLIIPVIVHNNRKGRDSLSSEADSWVKNGLQENIEMDLNHVKESKIFTVDFL